MIHHRRLSIADYPLLRELRTYLYDLPAPADRFLDCGDWRADLAAGPPAEDRTRPRSFRFQIIEWKQPAWMPSDATIASVNYFPPGGAGLGWHTDSSRAGWRVYIGRPLEGVRGELVLPDHRCPDVDGAANAFHVSGEPRASWHGVSCEGARLSVGIRINGPATARALGLPILLERKT